MPDPNASSTRPPLLGILGGMGPLATVDLMAKIIAATPAVVDQDHVPMLVASLTQIAPRVPAWERGDNAPLAGMIDGLQRLERGGATLGVIACNTAHLWFDAMRAAVDLPLLHIADAAVLALQARAPRPRCVGLLATAPTLLSRLYHDRLEAGGFVALSPEQRIQDERVTPAIAAIKGNDLERGRALTLDAARALIDAGADVLLLGCTEMPVALAGTAWMPRSLDATAALADACVAWWLARRDR